MWIRLGPLPSHAKYDAVDKDDDLLSVGLTSCQSWGEGSRDSSTSSHANYENPVQASAGYVVDLQIT